MYSYYADYNNEQLIEKSEKFNFFPKDKIEKFSWDRQSKNTFSDVGYGSLYNSALSLAPSTSTSYTASVVPTPEPCVDASSAFSVSVRTASLWSVRSKQSVSPVSEEPLPISSHNENISEIPIPTPSLDKYMPKDQFYSYGEKSYDSPILFKTEPRRREEINFYPDCYKCTWKKCSRHEIKTEFCKAETFLQEERKAVKERSTEATLEHMEASQEGYRFRKYVSSDVRTYEIIQKLKITNPEHFEKKPKKNSVKSKIVSAIGAFKKLGSKFSIRKISSEEKKDEKEEQPRENIQKKEQGPARESRRVSQKPALPAVVETLNEEEEMYDGHPDCRETYGPKKTPFDEEMGSQGAFLLDDTDVESSREPGTQMTSQAVFRYLYWKIGKHNTSHPERRVALIHPNYVYQTYNKRECNLPKSFEDNLCYNQYGDSKPALLMVPIRRGPHFVVSVFGKDEDGNIRVHVLNSLEEMDLRISQKEAEEIGRAYFKPSRRVKIQIEYSSRKAVQIQKENSNDCGVFTIENVERYLLLPNQEMRKMNTMMRLKNKMNTTAKRKEIFEQLKNIQQEDNCYIKENEQPTVTQSGQHNVIAKSGHDVPQIIKYQMQSKLKKDKKREAFLAHQYKKGEQKKSGRPSVLKEECVQPPSHKKRETTVDREKSEDSRPDLTILNKFLFGTDDVNSLPSERERTKFLQRMQAIGQKTVGTSMSSETSMFSSSDGMYSPQYCGNHQQKELTSKQKKMIVKLHFEENVPIERLIDRFNLCPDVKAARMQVMRIHKEVTSNTPNKRQCYRQLRNRVQVIMEHADEVEKTDIHEADIQRAGIEQAVCFGMKTFKASRRWVHKMKKQACFSSRHIDARITKAPTNTSYDVEAEIKKFLNVTVPEIKKKYSIDQIYNVDQTGLKYEMTRNRTLTKTGSKRVERVCQRKNATTHSFTVNPCISASGKLIGRTFVTLKEPKPPKSFRRMVAPFRKLHVTHSKSGKMTSQLAVEWMEKVFLPNVSDNSLLLCDSWSGFNDMKKLPVLKRRKIEVIVLPKKSTSRLQPLDLNFNRQFKHFLNILQSEVRRREKKLIIGKRDVELDIVTLAINQFQAPRFAGLMQRGFEMIGIRDTPHQPYETPAEFCFKGTSTFGKNCSGCRNLSLIICAYCEKLFCVKCSLKHLH